MCFEWPPIATGMTALIPAAFRPLRLALIQLATTADKQSNLRQARLLVKEACTKGANVVVLPVRTPFWESLTIAGVL
jgi:hypothetical protein